MLHRLFRAQPLALSLALVCLLALTSAHTATVVAPDGARVTDLGGLVNKSDHVRLPLAGGLAHDVLFEPIALPPGEAYSLDWVDGAGATIARYDLQQVDATTTDLYLHLGGNWSDITHGVSVKTEHDGVVTGTVVHGAAPRIYLGSVTAPTSAWAETYHTVCGPDGCEVHIDPPNTTIDLAGDDTSGDAGAVPFHLIKAKFAVDPARLEGETSLVMQRTYSANIDASLSTVR